MENGGEIRRDQKRSDWIFRFIPILLIAFVLFFVFKLQGGWDVSSNFGVRTITAGTKETYRRLSMETKRLSGATAITGRRRRRETISVFSFPERRRSEEYP